jgi:uncharacterized protein
MGGRTPAGSGRARGRVGAALAAAMVVALVAVGCGSSSPATEAATQATLSANGVDAGITVTGTGDVSGRPDTLTAQFGILAKQPSVSAAVAGAGQLAATVVTTLKGKGVAETDIQTQNYTVSPSFTTVKGRQVPDGYLVGETLSVRLHDLASAGGVIDAVTQSGGDLVSVQSVSFTLEDNQQLLAQARKKAWTDAQSKASQLSHLSGRQLGPAEGIDETTTPSAFVAQSASLREGFAATDIEPGQVSTTVSVNIRFSWK